MLRRLACWQADGGISDSSVRVKEKTRHQAEKSEWPSTSGVGHSLCNNLVLLHDLVLDLTGECLRPFRTDLEVSYSYLDDHSIPKGEEGC